MSDYKIKTDNAFSEIEFFLDEIIKAERRRLDMMIDTDDDERYENESRQYRIVRKKVRSWKQALLTVKEEILNADFIPGLLQSDSELFVKESREPIAVLPAFSESVNQDHTVNESDPFRPSSELQDMNAVSVDSHPIIPELTRPEFTQHSVLPDINNSDIGQRSVLPDINDADIGQHSVLPDINDSDIGQRSVLPDINDSDIGQRSVLPDINDADIGQHSVLPDINDSDIGQRSVLPDINDADIGQHSVLPDINDADIGQRSVLPDMNDTNGEEAFSVTEAVNEEAAEYVRNCISDLEKDHYSFSDLMLKDLCNAERSREWFGIRTALFSKICIVGQYWEEPFRFNDDEYYLASDWDDDSCQKFDDWYLTLFDTWDISSSTDDFYADPFPDHPNSQDSNVLPDEQDYPEMNDLPDFPSSDQMSDYPEMNDLPDFPSSDQMSDYPEMNDLPDFPSPDQMSDYPEMNDLPDFPSSDQMSDYPEMNDLPGFPDNEPEEPEPTEDLSEQSPSPKEELIQSVIDLCEENIAAHPFEMRNLPFSNRSELFRRFFFDKRNRMRLVRPHILSNGVKFETDGSYDDLLRLKQELSDYCRNR